jgi:hypothetical protein
MPSLVIVGDLHIEGITVFPSEADPPLVVDPDAVLSFPIAGKLLQTIPGRNSQVAQRISRVEHEELPQGRAVNTLRKAPRALAIEDSLGLRVSKAPNHGPIVTCCVNNVKR